MLEQVTLNTIWILISSYAVFTLVLIVLWVSLHRYSSPIQKTTTTISVLIPVRNEEDNILALLQDLNVQTLPCKNFEVIVIDDASTDRTREFVKEFSTKANFRLTLLELPDKASTSPKKRAIETAVGHASGTLIVTTDGDCRVTPGWLSAFSECYDSNNAKAISGPVTFTKEEYLTDHMQTIEFSSLIGSGACAIAAGTPTMCNGANFCYPKAVFLEVDGFEGSRHIASGDDEFLMHKIAAKFPGQIHFLKNPKAVVQTQPHRKWSQFYRQRKRWASKWKHYKTPTPILLAAYIFFCNFALLVALTLLVIGSLTISDFLILLALKWIPEWLLLGTILRFLGKSKSLIFIPVVQLFYPFYVTLFGLVSQKGEYTWKDRKLT